jgi:diguanylate cyclase (GGDEF)-like protein
MQAHGDTLGLLLIKGLIAGDLHKVIRNISEQIALAISNLKLQQRLLNLSIRDPLTGLFNRRYLEETIEREFSRARREKQPVSVLALDIDHFKRFNDTMGHEAGDSVLVQFAKVMLASIRKDDIACRSGGEEFILLLPQTTAEMALQRARNICEATHAMQNEKGKDSFGSVTVSIGVATFPADGDSPKQVIARADKALYEAKNNGRDQVRVVQGA